MNFFTSHGLPLAYRVDGPDDAPTLLLINSLGTNMHMWDQQVEQLSPVLRIVRYDSRGHGSSDVPAGPYTLEQLGSDLLALLNTLQIEQAHICGLSLGGIVALWLAITYPDRVAHAVFANTAARIGTEESWDARIDTVKAGGIAAIHDAVIARFLSAKFREHNPAMTQQISDMVKATDPVGYNGSCAALRNADLRTRVNAIRVPSLIIAGALDESTPPSQAHELHAAITGSQLIIFDEVAHLSNIERPKEFSQYVLHFLMSA